MKIIPGEIARVTHDARSFAKGWLNALDNVRVTNTMLVVYRRGKSRASHTTPVVLPKAVSLAKPRALFASNAAWRNGARSWKAAIAAPETRAPPTA